MNHDPEITEPPRKKKPKPYVIEYMCCDSERQITWRVWGRYATERARDRALVVMQNKRDLGCKTPIWTLRKRDDAQTVASN